MRPLTNKTCCMKLKILVTLNFMHQQEAPVAIIATQLVALFATW